MQARSGSALRSYLFTGIALVGLVLPAIAACNGGPGNGPSDSSTKRHIPAESVQEGSVPSPTGTTEPSRRAPAAIPGTDSTRFMAHWSARWGAKFETRQDARRIVRTDPTTGREQRIVVGPTSKAEIAKLTCVVSAANGLDSYAIEYLSTCVTTALAGQDNSAFVAWLQSHEGIQREARIAYRVYPTYVAEIYASSRYAHVHLLPKEAACQVIGRPC